MNDKPALHFSHANSFPAGTYRKFLSHFAPHYDIGYIETLGHDPRYPVTDCWPHLVEQTVDFIEQRYQGPVLAVGHSLGGFLSFMAALQRPELFRAVVLLDSPIFGRPVSTALWLGKRFGFIERMTPGQGSLRRRRHWPSIEAATAHFQAKHTFASFDPECLNDYVTTGTVPCEEGVRLKFEPEVEYRIYCGLPHFFPRLRGRLKVPTGFIGGRSSEYVRRSDIVHMRRDFGIELMRIDGGHLFPFERPQATAEAVYTMLGRLGVKGADI
ncbi:alpha/beta fold hydrolase [Chitinimonas lacunae]|uniref:Alpha/beta fold hydrolase n=1 Tax=Chitinimonas lacunae TaxID=1963018 RepID=A0ABV8MP30_9NEIS